LEKRSQSGDQSSARALLVSCENILEVAIFADAGSLASGNCQLPLPEVQIARSKCCEALENRTNTDRHRG
jgi:hypothetical protein